jgi:hypothetical protein
MLQFDAWPWAEALFIHMPGGPDEVVIAMRDVRLHDAAAVIGYRTRPATTSV